MDGASPLADKTAIVTGASSGIGRAIAFALGQAGAHVFLAGRTRAPMEAEAKRIEQAGGRASAVTLDVRNLQQLRELVESAVRETGRLDVMVNNAGLSHRAPIAEQDPEEWREMLEVNVLALLAGCQAAIRAMRACRARGHIVNVSSIAGQADASGVYGATKAAVDSIATTLRKELEDDAIRVVNVRPGAVMTNFARHFDPALVEGFAKAAGVELAFRRGEHLPEDVATRLQERARPLLAAPEDVARAVLFAVTQPIELNVFDIVIRPQKQIQL